MHQIVVQEHIIPQYTINVRIKNQPKSFNMVIFVEVNSPDCELK
jgi:hypothetical protein